MSITTTEKKTFVNTLKSNSYGKSMVRLTKVDRHCTPPRWKEITVATELRGEFETCYLDGDNSKIVATDSIKNTVYVMASKHGVDSLEEFALIIAKHYLDDYAHVAEVEVNISEDAWAQIEVDGDLHPTAFVKSREDIRNTKVSMNRKETRIESGIDNLAVAKITDSEFSGFIRDSYTTLKDSSDRIFGTKINAHWTYNTQSTDFNNAYETARKTMLKVFAHHHSLSAQQTLFAMGEAVIETLKDVEEISLTLPNIHRIPFDMKPFGQENRNEIFVTTSEPYGVIKGQVSRKK
jgi:urate oxidase